jgi:hypothetical protein
MQTIDENPAQSMDTGVQDIHVSFPVFASTQFLLVGTILALGQRTVASALQVIGQALAIVVHLGL